MQNDSVYLDTLPFQVFEKLKKKFPTKMILIRPEDLTRVGVLHAYENAEEYVREHFKLEGIQITRYRHNYKSLDGENPEMGVVFMANDSVLVPGMEAWVLVGHNASYLPTDRKTSSDS